MHIAKLLSPKLIVLTVRAHESGVNLITYLKSHSYRCAEQPLLLLLSWDAIKRQETIALGILGSKSRIICFNVAGNHWRMSEAES